MKIQKNESAPEFLVRDVNGNSISLASLRGQKVYVAFMRFAGCPVCNLRVHTLLKHAENFRKHHTKVLLVYESSPEVMREYLSDEAYPFVFIADPQSTLYTLYSVEASWSKIMAGMFHGLLGKFLAGNKLYKKKIAMDGKQNRLEAEFLINEQGKIQLAHYSKFLGDSLPIEEILNA